MPQKQAAKKALRQSVKKTGRNLQVKKKVEFLTRQIQKTLGGKNLSAIEKLYKDLQQTLDKAAKNHVFHPNKAARTKSRLSKRIKALKK
ncbi:30S ribosomal protein S20 [Candidatus Falkowbacteria bacterium]|nr:30S ribosomal protein S20 [Candidatus Falkowbacteria bacterium]